MFGSLGRRGGGAGTFIMHSSLGKAIDLYRAIRGDFDFDLNLTQECG